MKAHINFCYQTYFLDIVLHCSKKKKRGIFSRRVGLQANVLHTSICHRHRDWATDEMLVNQKQGLEGLSRDGAALNSWGKV